MPSKLCPVKIALNKLKSVLRGTKPRLSQKIPGYNF